MATFRSFSEIVSTMIQRLGLVQPNLDTKTGTVSRDLFVDLPADQMARLYSALNLVAEKQSLATTTGSDLNRLALNFGVSRSTGSNASGIVVIVTNSLVSDISIPSGTELKARNGVSFGVVGNHLMSAADKNRLSANANRLRKALNIAGLNSSYALEVPVQALRAGTSGNVGSLQVTKIESLSDVSAINLTAMSGGSNIETDDSFRTRILAIFSGANTGTSAGYRNSVLGTPGVLDALVVEPGDSLMLRDGTEVLELDDGTNRIISSGTGGKVDIYILGRSVESITESYLFTDLSGSGNISDERNDYILGQTGQDLTRTSEERRVLAFKTGSLPAQPADSMVSVTGSSSGLLTEAFADSFGIIYGNYELEKDMNPETGGSPFGFDKIRYISNTKSIREESVGKASNYSIDSLAFSDINQVDMVYQDILETSENSSVSSAGKNYIKLLHTPVVRVSRVQNRTTGEVYSVTSQGLGDSGLNEDGIVEIKGRTLPTAADILSVNYTWRKEYDPYIDYYTGQIGQFGDKGAADSIDWTTSGGIPSEESIILKTDDGLSYKVDANHNINKVLSVFSQSIASGTISEISSADGSFVVGIELSSEEDVISNVSHIRRVSDGLELYTTGSSDGSFSTRDIVLPTDSQGKIGDDVTVFFNRAELFDLDNTDGSYYNKTIILPSEGILDSAGISDIVEDTFLSEDSVFIDYVADAADIYQKVSLDSLPINGSSGSNFLETANTSSSDKAMQPITYSYGSGFSINGISKFSPTKISAQVTGLSKAGKIKIAGTTVNRYAIDISAGVSKKGRLISIESELKSALGLSEIPGSIGIARVDRVVVIDDLERESFLFDTLGCSLKNTDYSYGLSALDTDINSYEFLLPSTPHNSSGDPSSGDIIRIHVLVYNTDAHEEAYFDKSSSKTTDNRFARIDRVSVSSGFRSTTGNLVGSIYLTGTNQPKIGGSYFVDYNFLAPKEGERITISYNVNSLILDSTVEAERVRPITADVLVKEAEALRVDVEGAILINEDSISDTNKIVESVTNSVSNLLSRSRLGGIIDYSDVIAVAAAEAGVDSVNISRFNESEKTGRKPFVKALENQYISAGSVIFKAVSRNKFRIN